MQTPAESAGHKTGKGTSSRAVFAGAIELDLGPEIPATRITSPNVPRHWLPRPRLNARLGVPPDKRLILVTSAPGFGKSSCLAAWHRKLASAGIPVAWLTAERSDGDVHTFFAYLAAALQRTSLGIGGDVVEIVGRRGETVPAPVLEHLLVNALAAQSAPVVLIVDDYHTIASPAIDEAVGQLIAHMPENVHLVIAGRGAPAIRLGKLRAAGQVLELGPADLAFDFEETRSFLRDRCDIDVASHDVAALLEASEGWVASLQTVAIAMRASHDVRRALRSITGQPQMLRRYMREEVTHDLPPGLRDFLLRSSIPDTFNAELAAAVTGVPDAAVALAEIERRGLFLIALDDEGTWYRYHHLFAECLRKELAQTCPSEIAALHLRAAEWLAGARRWGEAVRHAQEARAPERALGIVEGSAMELVQRGDYLTLTGLLKRLPEAGWRGSIKLALAYAWALAYGGFRVETEEVLGHVAARLDAFAPEEVRAIAVESTLVRFAVAGFADRTDHIMRLVAENEFLLHSRDPWAMDVVNVSASLAYIYAGEFERARECLPCHHPFKRIYQLLVNGMGWWRQGRPSLAEQEYNRALELALSEFGARSISAVTCQCFSASMQYERGECEALELALGNRIDFIEEVAPTDALVPALTTLAWSRASRGHAAEGEALLNRGRILGRKRRWLRAEALTTLELMRLAADHNVGDIGHLTQCAEEVLAREPLPAEPSTVREALQCFRLAAAFGVAFSSFGSVHLDRLDKTVAEIGALGNLPLSVKANLLLARACVQHNDAERARKAMAAAEAMGERTGMRQTLRDPGPWARGLMPSTERRETVVATRQAPDPTPVQPARPAASLAAVPSTDGQAGRAGIGKDSSDAISLREREVLQLVERGLSNKEIGRALRIGPETVKWHLKNVFAKLGVSNRIQAIHSVRSAPPLC